MKFSVKKTAFTCTRDGLTIRGYCFISRKVKLTAETKLPAVILSHGFLADQKSVFTYAEELADQGFAAFTFDFNGGGIKTKSDGKSVDMTVFTEKQDLLSVVDYVRSVAFVDPANISLLGCSQGGFVSALVAATLKEQIANLVLFFPALCIPDDVRRGNILVAKFNPEDIPDVLCNFPMKLGGNYARSILDVDPYKEISGYDGRTLIIHGTADRVVNVEYSRKAKPVYKNLTYHEIEGADHGFRGEHDKFAIQTLLGFLKNA